MTNDSTFRDDFDDAIRRRGNDRFRGLGPTAPPERPSHSISDSRRRARLSVRAGTRLLVVLGVLAGGLVAAVQLPTTTADGPRVPARVPAVISVRGNAMLPTLVPNQEVRTIGIRGAVFRRGDVVAVKVSRDLRPAASFSDELVVLSNTMVRVDVRSANSAPSFDVLRIVGLPGERIAGWAGRILINGQPVDEPWLADPASADFAELTVPENKFFVLGDLRYNAVDSRSSLGPVGRSSIVARVPAPKPALVFRTTNQWLNVYNEPATAPLETDVAEQETRVRALPRVDLADRETRALAVLDATGSQTKVALDRRPTQPDGFAVGWVSKLDGSVTPASGSLRVDLTHRELTWEPATSWMRVPVAIGADPKPTPTGQFRVVGVRLHPEADSPWGPAAIRTNARSRVIENFGGEDEYRISLQGTNEPKRIGQAISNGNIRATNDVISAILKSDPIGMPLDIVA